MTPRTELLSRLEDEFGVVMRRAKRVVSERARLVHPDLQPLGGLLLVIANREGPLRASAYVDLLDVDKASVSRHVQHLVELGLVEQRPDPADGRASLVAITPLGADRLAVVTAARRDRLAGALEDFPSAELETFVDLLGRYNRLLET